MPNFCEPVFDPVFLTSHVEHVGQLCCRWSVLVARRESELDAIVGENDVDFVGNGLDECFQESRGCFPVGFVHESYESKLTRSINGNVEMQSAFCGLQFGNIDVEIADGIALELLALGFIAIDIRQARYSMALQTSMQS